MSLVSIALIVVAVIQLLVAAMGVVLAVILMKLRKDIQQSMLMVAGISGMFHKSQNILRDVLRGVAEDPIYDELVDGGES